MDSFFDFTIGLVLGFGLTLALAFLDWEDRNAEIKTSQIIKIEQNLYKCQEVFVND